jgi:two-component system, NarL family, nitrate/nitrite response regulator NarL
LCEDRAEYERLAQPLFRAKVEPVRILVVAADPVAAAGLLETLPRHPTISVALYASEDQLAGNEGAAEDSANPQVVVWDFGGEPALQTDAPRVDTPRTDVVSAAYPNPVIALVSDENDASGAMAAGVHAVLPRDADADLIASAAVAVAHGLLVFDRAYAPGAYLARPLQAPVPIEELTPRESDILQLLAEGMSNKGIAQRLGISEHTVKFHLNAILGKLDAHTRTEAVTRAARLGWIVL